MRKGTLNREQVVALVGESSVAKLERENCDFTGRLQIDGDDAVEFSSSIRCEDKNGEEVVVVAYYYQDPEDLDGVEDLGNLDWEINGFEII